MTQAKIKKEAIEKLNDVVKDYMSRGWAIFNSSIDRDDTISLTTVNDRDKCGKIWIHRVFFVVYQWETNYKTYESKIVGFKIRTKHWLYDREKYLEQFKEEGEDATE